MRLLVIGGDGLLGSTVADIAGERGYEVRRTTRRGGMDSNRTHHLDLSSRESVDAFMRLIPDLSLTHAILCAGVTSVDACEANPQASMQINVARPLEIIRRLGQLGVPTTILSSSSVYAGQYVAGPTESTTPMPTSQYGQQKRLLELALLSEPLARIVRLTKVVSHRHGRWVLWLDDIMAGRPVKAFTNLRLAPLDLVDTARWLVEGFHEDAPRLTHLSPPDDLTYLEALTLAASASGLDPRLVLGAEAPLRLKNGLVPDQSAALATLYPEMCTRPDASRVMTLVGERFAEDRNL